MTSHPQTALRQWRHNPLCRRSDVIEAWTGLVTMSVLLVGPVVAGTAVGVAVHDAQQSAARVQSEERQPVTARLTEDAPRPSLMVSAESEYPVSVRWTAPDGSKGTGSTTVPVGSQKGSETRIWLDRDGRMTDAPLNSSDVWLRSLSAGGAAAVGVAGTVLLVRAGVRRSVERQRLAEWGQEWARVGPEWGGYARPDNRA